MKKIVLNYIYLSRTHAGGKNQVGLNLLKGFQDNNVAKYMSVICYEYSVDVIRSLSKDIEIIKLPSPSQGSELKRMIGIFLTNTFSIHSIIKKYNFDVIFHLDCNNGLRKFKCKSILIPHDIKAISHRDLPGLHISFLKYNLCKIMYALDFRHADKIVGISDIDKKEIQEYYPQYEKKVVRIYNPIDIPVCTKLINDRKPYILAINLQFHHKNIITLIKAFELIKDEITEDLVLVGNVPNRVKYLTEYVEEHNLGERVKFTGFISEQERNELLQTCRLYVSPTLFEGFGMVSIEAIISGVPTLLSKIPVNYEVTQGLCEYYEPAEDEKALAKKIIAILKSVDNSDEALKKARILYEKYNYKQISTEYLKIMNSDEI